jgi:hypothetical protein
MRIKEYPDKRVCTIDFLPLLEDSLKEVYMLCKKYKIPFTVEGRGSTDITKFFYHYCLDKFCNSYSKCKTKYPKVIVVYDVNHSKVVRNFVKRGLDKVLKVLPVPYCKVKTFDSPDTAMAALSVLSKTRLVSSKLQKFAKTNQLHDFIKKSGKSKYFPVGTVDLPLVQE